MPSIDRPLSGPVLVQHLEEERKKTADATILARSGRNARTLVKDGPLRVTLVVVAKGGAIPPHKAEGPITVQPLAGRIRFRTPTGEQALGPGDLLALGAGIEHSVEADEEAAFLLTVVLR
jgi:quercetin dioxygenase-like cupin family protein